MGKYTAHLRYYTGDPLEEIRQQDLEGIGRAYGVGISYEKIDNRTLDDGMLVEETLDKAIEEISQDVITVGAEDEDSFRQAIAAIYQKYRSPRTPYGFWGSTPEAGRLAKAIADETGGGW
jgi:hypothetical protein